MGIFFAGLEILLIELLNVVFVTFLIRDFLNRHSLLNFFETFKANKIDDGYASQVEEEKLVTLGLAYGDILN